MHRIVTLLLIAVVAFSGCREDKKKPNNNNNNINNVNNNTTGDTIYMVQDPSHQHFVQDGDEVVLTSKVVTAVDKYGSRTGSFWISEANGGAWSGVQVYNTDTTSAWWGELRVGDLVTVHGRKMEYSYLDPQTNDPLFDDPLTEIVEASVTRLGSGTPLTPTEIPAADLASVATGEKWEGVLVRLTNVRVSTVRERDGRLEVNLFGSTKAQDDLFDLTSVNEGVCISRLTGVVTYFFNYYLMPRSASDIELAANDADCAEIVAEICDNEIDDDGNGFTDCDDWACAGNVACPAKAENDDTLCADGLDNDEDGLIDCADPSCSGHPHVTVCTETNCTDGIDNDGDTHIDCADWDCLYTEPTCAVGKEITDETCSDGLDQDGNNFIDCRDFSCQKSPLVTVCEGNAVTCSDGIDNDGNGFIDCADFACRYCHATDPARDRVVSTCPRCVR